MTALGIWKSVLRKVGALRSPVFNFFSANALRSNERTKMLSKIQFNGGGGLQAYISSKIRRSGEEWSYHVEHLGKSRLRIVRGSGHACRFICAKAQAGRNGIFGSGPTKCCWT